MSDKCGFEQILFETMIDIQNKYMLMMDSLAVLELKATISPGKKEVDSFVLRRSLKTTGVRCIPSG